MKRTLLILSLILLAVAAMAIEPPEFGLYEATGQQFAVNGSSDLSPITAVFTFRVAFSEDYPDEVWMLWDYDNDGLEDESIEIYKAEKTSEFIAWTDSSNVFSVWRDPEEGTYHILMELRDGDYLIQLRQITSDF